MSLAHAFVMALAILFAPRPASAQDVVPLDRTTPRRAVESFLHASRDGDYLTASHTLDLRELPRADRARIGPELARKLRAVLDARLWIDLEQLSDDTAGNASDGDRTEHLGDVTVGADRIPIELELLRADRGWSFSATTVARTPALYESLGSRWLEERVPRAMTQVRFGGLESWQWLGLLIAIALGVILGPLIAFVIVGLAKAMHRASKARWDGAALTSLRAPLAAALACVAFLAALGPLRLSMPVRTTSGKLAAVALIAALVWLLLRSLATVADALERSLSENDRALDVRARGRRTQVVVLRRVFGVLVGVVGVAAMLVQFEIVRSVGMSLLASAGIAGVVLGLAAQKTIGSLLAGIQLSITQPMRIGDVVVVDGHWGRVEEVHLTYVVIKVWDERRAVFPITRFLEEGFENWTRGTPQLTGAVLLYADYGLPVDAMRTELDRILEGDDRFDGRLKKVAVTNVTERTLEVRVLVSAPDADNLADLRNAVREKLVAWLRTYDGGAYLPRSRVTAQEPILGEV